MSPPEATPLGGLLSQAKALARGEPVPPTPDEAEVARQMSICNACRYCEGHCAVFPAMTRRLVFDRAAVHYLANLCHGCGACLHACQYAPPHEFGVSVPQAMARVRVHTYADHAWPAAFGALYRRSGLTLALALTAGLALFLMLAVATRRPLWGAVAEGGFYAIFPHGLMVGLFAPVFGFVLLALGIGVWRFWRLGPPGPASGAAVAEAGHDMLRLHYLDGGHGRGCHNDDDAWTDARRRWHHLCFYGFALCFASTSVATVYHYAFGWIAPYGWTSLPKLLGTVGGVMMVAGAAGLWRLNRRRHPDHVEASQRPMDLGFIALLCLVGASGLALALGRSGPAMPLLLCLHLGAVMAFFLTMPYGKFVHGVYRGVALLMWAVERRRPSGLRLGPD